MVEKRNMKLCAVFILVCQLNFSTSENQENGHQSRVLPWYQPFAISGLSVTYLPQTIYYPIAWPETNSTGSTSEKSLQQPQGRILGGTTAVSQQFPYYLFVESSKANGIVNCGAALLSDAWAITAATCVYLSASIRVYAGIIKPPTASDVVTYAKAHLHPKYKTNLKTNNLALLKFYTPLVLSESISPIKIVPYDLSRIRADIDLRTMGLGSDDDSRTVGTALKYVDLPRVKRSPCYKETFSLYLEYPTNTDCLKTVDGTKGFCYVDVGGPVVYTLPGDSKPKLVGINSEFIGCPSKEPMAYTKLSSYIRWIKKETKQTFL